MRGNLIVVLFAAFLAACSAGEPTQPSPTPTQASSPVLSPTSGPATASPLTTQTPAPTDTPEPAATPKPTSATEQADRQVMVPPGTIVEARNVELVGHIGGHTKAIFVRGNRAYAGFGPELAVLDISDPTQPVRVGYVVLPDIVRDVYVAGDYAYVATGEAGLRVVNISDLAAPSSIGFVVTPGAAEAVAVAGHYAYVADGRSKGLRVVDVSDPAAPVEIGFLATPQETHDVVVAGGPSAGAVLSSHRSEVPPEVPPELVEGPVEGLVEGSKGSGQTYAYVADGTGSLRVLDVSDLAAPTQVGFYDMPGLPEDVAVAGNYAYVADGYRYGLRIVDISNPAAPTEAGFLDMPGPAFGVAVAGGYSYVADGYEYVGGEPTGGGLRVVNISDPTGPADVGFHDTPGQALSVAVTGLYAYIGDTDAGLRVVDVSDPAAPVEVGFYETRGPASGVAVTEGYAYVADGWGESLRIVDVSDPAAPTEAGFYYMSGLTEGVAVASGPSTSTVLSSHRPEAPPEIPPELACLCGARRQVEGPVEGLDEGLIEGSKGSGQVYAYVTDRDGGLHVMDVSNAAAPVEAGFYNVPGSAMDVAVTDHQAFVAAGEGGLFLLKFVPPEPAATPAPSTPTPLPTEPPAGLHRPEGVFAELWTTDEELRQSLGWAAELQPRDVAAAFQPFEGGVMIWREDEGLIYALCRDGSWAVFDDTWTEDQPEYDPNIVAPAERFQPIRGFGKVWRDNPEVRGRMGWASQPERDYTSPIQAFERGVLIGAGDTTYGLIEVAGHPTLWYQR